MISDRLPEIKILCLLRNFVNAPKGCPFAIELKKILLFYSQKTLMPDETIKIQTVYDSALFQKLIPKSVLGEELKDKFVDLPAKAFDQKGELDPSYEVFD